MTASQKKIQRFLATRISEHFAKIGRELQTWSSRELDEAERLEKMGKRRINTLRVIRTERNRREGKHFSISTLKIKVQK